MAVQMGHEVVLPQVGSPLRSLLAPIWHASFRAAEVYERHARRDAPVSQIWALPELLAAPNLNRCQHLMDPLLWIVDQETTTLLKRA